MTNREVAKYLTNIVFNTNKCQHSEENLAVKTLIEAVNCPSKYSMSVGYTREDMEKAVFDFMCKYRKNGQDYMDLGEKEYLKQRYGH